MGESLPPFSLPRKVDKLPTVTPNIEAANNRLEDLGFEPLPAREGRPKPRQVILTGDGGAVVPLTRGFEALVDAADAALVAALNWYVKVGPRTFYAQANVRKAKGGARTMILLHRLLMLPPSGMLIDHINGDGLDNRRGNLRLATDSENNYNSRPRNNTSGFKGVRRDRSRGKWEAKITLAGRSRSLGRFATAEEAARAYDNAAQQLHGLFARTNADLGLLA